MAHEIERHGEQAAFVSAREDAWHRLGTVVDHAMTAEEALTLGHLAGWNVRKTKLTTHAQDSKGRIKSVKVPGSFAITRTNPFTGDPEALATVGSRYQIIQNEDNAELLDTIVDEGGAHFETAGSLRDGRETFLTMKLPEAIQVGGVDRVDLYMAAINSFDGKTPVRIITTPTRVVCANTLRLAFSRAESEYRIKHTSGATAKISEARAALGVTFAYGEAFQAEADKLIDRDMTNAEFAAITEELFPRPDEAAPEFVHTRWDDTQTDLRWLFAEADTQAVARGTAWAAFNAITEWADWYMPVRGGDGTEQVERKRAERVLTSDTVRDLKVRAFELVAG